MRGMARSENFTGVGRVPPSAAGPGGGDGAAVAGLLREAHAQAVGGRPESAVELYARVLEMAPDEPTALLNLGGLCCELLMLDQARAALERFVQRYPLVPEGHNNLGSLYLFCGLVPQAIEAHRRALELRPAFFAAHSNLLHALLYSDDQTPEDLFREHLEWARRHAPAPAVPLGASPIETDPERRLRIGYLSADFRRHPIATFIEPILAGHDRRRFRVTCYYDSPLADEVTSRLRGHVSGGAGDWVETAPMSDEQLAQRIAADGCDILVELAVHSGRNRLAALARRPAPVVISYLGYAFTTGLACVDYRLTDAVLDPPGMTEALHTERLLRLPRSFWCFRAPPEAPEVVEALPEIQRGYVTFGSANRLAKVSATTLRCWARVLRGAPASARLRLIAPELRAAWVRAHWLAELERHGISRQRVDLLGAMPMAQYLSELAGFDMALDTFPFTGGATTCHALHMGVPVVTRAGRTPIARVSASVLAAIGRSDWVAADEDEFVRIALRLAGDLPGLAAARRELRPAMMRSALMDELAFAGELEGAYRQAWRAGCAAPPSQNGR
jgi:predicted O-linked N-acetylglucosamine transferase (SPINDLY family)